MCLKSMLLKKRDLFMFQGSMSMNSFLQYFDKRTWRFKQVQVVVTQKSVAQLNDYDIEYEVNLHFVLLKHVSHY